MPAIELFAGCCLHLGKKLSDLCFGAFLAKTRARKEAL
jgi:hypothetical protein